MFARRKLTARNVVLLISFTAPSAIAQAYPTKTIRMIVAAAPGGANDILGRMYAQRMTEALGQTVVVDNRGWRWRRGRR
jgi:tripartite-type tricarboxylate transporter receptor subunit TctC